MPTQTLSYLYKVIQKGAKNGFNLPLITTVNKNECSEEIGNITCK